MTILTWRNANLRSGSDKGLVQTFRCTDEDLRTEYTIHGLKHTHSRMYEWHVQQLIQGRVRGMKKSRWIVRLGLDDAGLGAVMATEETDAGHNYYLVVGAIASRLRRQHGGALGREMLEDTFAAIGDRCAEAGFSGEVHLSAQIHRDNTNSQRMSSDKGFRCTGDSPDAEDYEDWARMLPIPEPELPIPE